MNLSRLRFTDYAGNPLIRPPFPEPIIADPCVLPPPSSPDLRWHLFAHSLFGLRHYTSSDGTHWSRPSSIIIPLAYRPFIYPESGLYYLIYEKLHHLLHFPHYSSHLEIRSSSDLISWSPPAVLLRPSLPWHISPPSSGNVGNPCLVKFHGRYLLFYSAGLIRLPDYGFCEPARVGLAVSSSLTGPYSPQPRPLSWSGLPPSSHVSAVRAYAAGPQLFALQTRISSSGSGSLYLASSSDALRWYSFSSPLVNPDSPWKKSGVYIGSLARLGRQFRLYYNARAGHRVGTESIGLATASI